MRLLKNDDGRISLWLSANDTYEWATHWPCSQLSGKRLFAEFEPNGDLVDMAINGHSGVDVSADEFNAITTDFIAVKYSDHPACRV
jgi:hypothetical protein